MVCGVCVGLARLLQAQRTTAWSTTNGSAPKTVTSLSSRHFTPPKKPHPRENSLHTRQMLLATLSSSRALSLALARSLVRALSERLGTRRMLDRLQDQLGVRL
jgi:hypothetical protein